MGSTDVGTLTQGDTLQLDQARSYLEEKRKQANIHVVSPVQTVLSDAFANYPLTTAFGSVFLALSFIPIATFIGFTVFAGSVLIGGAVIFVAFWGALVVGIAACVLLFTLSITFFLAVLATGFIASAFLAFRLVSQVSSSDDGLIQGIKNFGSEVRQRATGPPPRKHLRTTSSSSSKRDSAASTLSADAPEALSPASSSSDSWKMEGEQ